MTPEQVAEAVGKIMGVDPAAIMGCHRGSPETSRARWIAMWVFSHRYVYPGGDGPSLSAVGRAFGRDRTTVRHGLRKVEDWRLNNPEVNELLKVICFGSGLPA